MRNTLEKQVCMRNKQEQIFNVTRPFSFFIALDNFVVVMNLDVADDVFLCLIICS